MPIITTVEDLRRIYARRVPRMFYDYCESGSWTEQTFRDNVSDFADIRLRQRVAVDMEGRSTATTMIGQVIDSRFFKVSDYPSAAALSFVLMLAILVLVSLYIRRAGTEELL